MIWLAVALSVLVGVSLGLLGGGGAILMVPLLVYVAGQSPNDAIATSLLVVGVTSVVAVISYARAGQVRWKVAAIFGVAAMAGAYAGGLLSHYIPGSVLLVMFAVVMIGAGVAMLRPRTAAAEDHPLRPVRAVMLGAVVGVISGLVGAGGGFLLVPALALLAGLPMQSAVGTSLLIIAMQSFAGLGGHLASVGIDWPVAGMITAAAVIGALIGAPLAERIPPERLRSLFGWFVLLMAAFVLGAEVHPALGLGIAALTVAAMAAQLVCARTGHCPLRRWLGGGVVAT
ncbi:UPF0721 transmembrane protein [Mycolicibacterium insubricum]|uniref:Probable membrane transporter protein n=1 Tax=Mycolicibacterium insubricum TaxID=444597 RepID=A0A1X0DLR0_9MYCO|nr:sulfite exporter TauE/SafE family protein [Mycolicibacterium insubricum]MCB9440098.1 sulfite exporter TauE/SafE family protein [Mycolicibacterium sp.]MCV7082603.1 sulfite exporter TauE/SafE family protein [Mycolicibacterium insubricum]ORA72790.1 hypothetical protein BST26_04110 [Mycolicibacterium insubricum]BBZ66472.1 UPF0721 transmembrane protein [Mycolicibacterium insubricum]